MSSHKRVRKRLFVDAKVQGTFVLRVVCYWFLCLGTITLMLLCWRVLTGPARLFYTHLDELWYQFGPALVASFVLLPLIIVDVIRVSNRLVGPLLRLRGSMRDLARGEKVRPIRFRRGDFWPEFAEEFNALLERVQGTRDEPAADEQRRPEPVETAC